MDLSGGGFDGRVTAARGTAILGRVRLSVAIVTYERPDFLVRCLAGLREHAGDADVVVVDASRADHRSRAEGAFPGLSYVHAPKLAGWMTRSRNEALKWARGDVIAFLDDDVVVWPGWAEALRAAFGDEVVAAACGRTRNGLPGEESYDLPIGRLRADGTLTEGFACDPGATVAIDHGIGANMAFRRSTLAELGGFRDDYPGTALREDTDIFLRVRAIGGKSIYIPDAVVDHLPAPHVRGARFDTRYKLYGRRNHVVLLARDQGLFAPMIRRWIAAEYRRVAESSSLTAQVMRVGVTTVGIGWGIVAAMRQAGTRRSSPRRSGPAADAIRRTLRATPPTNERTERLRTFGLVIPTKERPDFVRQAVDSALRQRRAFDRIVVVTDGLDDPAREALADLPVEVVSIPPSGVADARNNGIASLRTEWVCFLDDDDLLHPDYLRRLEERVEAQPEISACNAPYWSFSSTAGANDEFSADDLDGCLEQSARARRLNDLSYLDIVGRSFDLLLERLRGSMSTAAIRRDVLVRAGAFPPGMAIAEDWTMYVNVARLTEWHLLDDRLAFFRDHESTATRAGGAAKGLMVLWATASFWDPSPLPTPPHRPLKAYAPYYRHTLSLTLAECVTARDIRRCLQALRLGWSVLPDRRDIARAMMPRRARAMVRRFRG
jgi:glycosyltransferase involved in cell wall biosynthesis